MIELSIVIFAYNEEENIEPVLRELRDWLKAREPRAEIIFVDDGSSDQTGGRAAEVLAGCEYRVLRHETNRGIGAALKTGVAAARGSWVTFLPADGQIAPGAIGTLRDEARRTGADVVFSVYDHRDDGIDRKVLSAGVRALIRLIHGVGLHSDGPYLFRRTLFVPEELGADTFFINFEFPIGVLRARLLTSEVTIACRPRRSGESKSARLDVIANVAKELVELRLRRARHTLLRLFPGVSLRPDQRE